MTDMRTASGTTASSYTAKLVDGPLEGKTIRTAFPDSGDPLARIEIAAATGAKHYVYLRSGGVEHEEGAGARPSAVEYRYREIVAG